MDRQVSHRKFSHSGPPGACPSAKRFSQVTDPNVSFFSQRDWRFMDQALMNVSSILDFLLTQKDSEMQTDLSLDVSYVSLAVDVFKVRDLTSIQALKDFLTVLPSPVVVKNVLIAAIHELSEVDPEAYRWLLCHSTALMPELDLVNGVKRFVCLKLEGQGFKVNQDFYFEANGQMKLTPAAHAELQRENSLGDRLLLEEILKI